MANNKRWQIAARKYDDLITQLLFNRGVDVDDRSAIARYSKPDFEHDLNDPFSLKNMEKAVLRIKDSIEKNETIGIFADYDADGIPGAALLFRTFRQIGILPVVYIPSREDGYGLSKSGLDFLKSHGCKLVVTIDLGIRSFAESDYAKEIGIDLIITDHHLPDEKIPDAYCVVNPKQKGDRYKDRELCGCAVGFKLAQGLSKYFPKKIDEAFLKWNLDLVAISTISDVVPLLGENRSLSQFGLIVARKTRNLGLSKLIQVAGIEGSKLSAYHFGFQIGPRINAPGRMGKATKSFELLVTEDETEATELAKWLNSENESRQGAMDEVEQDAIKQIGEQGLDKNKIIVVRGDWPKGVIGPTASRLVEKYSRPVILFAKEGEYLVGSARSVSGVNIVDLLTKVEKLLEKFGGHSGAAGVSMLEKNWNKFYEKIILIGQEAISDQDLIKKIKIDAKVDFGEMTKRLYEEILKLEPFGMGNPKPVFVSENVIFEEFRFVGKDQNHLQAKIHDGNSKIKSIHFSFPYDKSMIKSGQHYDIAFTLNLDEWNDRSEICLHIADIKLA